MNCQKFEGEEKKMATKICTKCKKTLDIENFSKNSNSKDKLSYICRKCNCSNSKKWIRENKERATKKVKEWQAKPENQKKMKEYRDTHKTERNNWFNSNAKKTGIRKQYYTRNKTFRYIKSGEIQVTDCKICGEKHNAKHQAHHFSYHKKKSYLDCIFLCPTCHYSLHFLQRKIGAVIKSKSHFEKISENFIFDKEKI